MKPSTGESYLKREQKKGSFFLVWVCLVEFAQRYILVRTEIRKHTGRPACLQDGGVSELWK